MSDVIEDLLKQIQADTIKAAAERDEEQTADRDDPKKDEDKDEDDKKKNPFPPEAKSAAELLAELQDILPEHIKAAMEVDAALQYQADLAQRALVFGPTKQAGLDESQIREIFDAAFDAEIQKFASLDPEFAGILIEDQARQAFNDGYNQVKAQAR